MGKFKTDKNYIEFPYQFIYVCTLWIGFDQISQRIEIFYFNYYPFTYGMLYLQQKTH